MFAKKLAVPQVCYMCLKPTEDTELYTFGSSLIPTATLRVFRCSSCMYKRTTANLALGIIVGIILLSMVGFAKQGWSAAPVITVGSSIIVLCAGPRVLALQVIHRMSRANANLWLRFRSFRANPAYHAPFAQMNPDEWELQ